MSSNIEKLNISENCRNQLDKVGISTVEEIVEILNKTLEDNLMIDAGWAGKCFLEIGAELERLGLWTRPNT